MLIKRIKPDCATKHQKSQTYKSSQTVLKYLPWVESKDGIFLLCDKTVGSIFELSDISSEAKPEQYLLQLRDGLQEVFQNIFPEYADEQSPWIIQFYVEDELTLSYLYEAIEDYIQPTAAGSDFTQLYLNTMKDYCQWASKKSGIFVDDKVSGSKFRAGRRKIHAVIYRQYFPKMKLDRGRDVFQDLEQAALRFISKLSGASINAKRYQGKDFYEWMVRWFNPNPAITKGNVDELLKMAPYPKNDDETPFGYDFAEQLFFSVPGSNEADSAFYFDGLPHRYLAIQQLSKVPELGHLTRERTFGNYQYGLFDKLPEGSRFVLNVVIQSQEITKNNLDRVEDTARKGNSTAAVITYEDCKIAKAAIEKGNYLFPASMGVYIHGNDLDDLEDKALQVDALLVSNGFHVLNGDHELLPIQSYLNNLPMCYNYQFDKRNMHRSGYVFGKQLANLLPLYGRERGTGHPLISFLNRGGESFTIDPFNPADKDQNSHLLLLGSTGSGKSATSTDMLIKIMGTYRPHLVMTDAGNSFGLLKDYFKQSGLSVHHVEVTLENPPILNPFTESEAMLKQIDKLNVRVSERALATLDAKLEKDRQEAQTTELDDKSSQEVSEQRDYMGEMALAAQLMITGGEQKEQDNLTRQDRMLILDALIRGAKRAKKQGFSQMIPEDVVNSLYEMAIELEQQHNKEPAKIVRLRGLADSMAFFCKDTIASLVFNRRGKSWPEADVILFEQGLFKDEGYEAHNALAFMGLMNRTMAEAERRQYEERFTLFYGDEIHTVTKNPLTAVYLTKCSKMSRKFGLWLWLATQNLADFTKESSKMLSMMEFWLCLGTSEKEMTAIEEFRQLSEEERDLFRSVRKSAKKYVEGVLLCSRVKALFRNVPPRLSLALAMTEKHEKAARKQLMKEYGISEIEAAMKIAKQME